MKQQQKKQKKKAPGFSMSRKGNANILYQNDHAIISKNDQKKQQSMKYVVEGTTSCRMGLSSTYPDRISWEVL